MLKEPLANLSVRLPYARLNLVRRELSRYSGGTILDLGCGDGYSTSILMRGLSGFQLTGLDAGESALQVAYACGIYGEFIRCDVRDAAKWGAYDIILACEIIEHLPKQDGVDLLESLEKTARKCIIVTSPPHLNRKREGTEEEDVAFKLCLHKGKPWEMPHVSVWKSEDYRKLGYQVYGANGAYIRGIPYVGMILAKWAYSHPDYANSIVAIKRMGGKYAEN